jgi:Lon protease-like protein
MSPTIKIPLFPLGVVLFPGMPLPLHIFEERYKLMINACLNSNSVFGVVYYTGEDFYQVGCTAKIKHVLKKFDDGRLNILTEGADRFTILQITSEKPYLTGEVEFYDDKNSDALTELKALSTAATRLFQDAIQSAAKTENMAVVENLDAKELSFLIAASAGFSLEEKQAFLEMTSTSERLKKAASALRRMTDRQKATKEIESIISGNGYLHNKKL